MFQRFIILLLALAWLGSPSAEDTHAQEKAASLGPALVGANNRAVNLVKEGRYKEAINLFEALDFSNGAPSEQALYIYNFGRALEANGDFEQAYAKYKFAVKVQPEFDAAVDGIFRILQDGKLYDSARDRIGAAVETLQQLLDKGRTDEARLRLHNSIAVWSREPEVVQLLTLLVRDYAASSFNQHEFLETEWTFLDSLRPNSSVREAIEEIRKAYIADFQPIFTDGERVFPAWAKSGDFSRLLKDIGDVYDHQHNRVKAIERYSLAVAVDIFNTEASLYAASVLHDDQREIDPQGKLLDQLIDAIFSAKGQAYYEVAGKPSNWEDILRFHIVLATIFESQGRWGSQEDPRSAVFQWEHAAHAEKEIAKFQPNTHPSPGVLLGLAGAYRQTHRLSQALDSYLAAANIFIETSRRREALAALKSAEALGSGSDRTVRMRERLGLVFGLVAKANNNPVYQAAKTGAEDEAKKLSQEKGLEITIDWRTPNEEDPRKQSDAIEQLVNAGASGIAVSVSDANKLTDPINEAVDSGVPVVCFDSDAPKSKRLADFGADDQDCGQKVMDELAKEMGGKGVVAILGGNQNATNLQKRVEGVREEAKKYPDIKILDAFYHRETPQDAAAKVEQVMQAHPEITGWAMIGGWPLFTDNALKFQPGTVKVVAVDALPAQIDYLRSGHVQVLLAQQVYEWGSKSVDILYDKVAENKNPPSTFVKGELIPITKDNVDEYAKNWEKWLPKK